MLVKTSMCQIEFAHEVGNRDSFSAPTPKMLGRGVNNAFACLLFLMGGISHINPHRMIYVIYNLDVNSHLNGQLSRRVTLTGRCSRRIGAICCKWSCLFDR